MSVFVDSSFSKSFYKETDKQTKQTADCDVLCFNIQDFCKPSNWPPIKELKITKSNDGQSCEFACLDEGLVCEPTFFTAINTQETMIRWLVTLQASFNFDVIVRLDCNSSARYEKLPRRIATKPLMTHDNYTICAEDKRCLPEDFALLTTILAGNIGYDQAPFASCLLSRSPTCWPKKQQLQQNLDVTGVLNLSKKALLKKKDVSISISNIRLCCNWFYVLDICLSDLGCPVIHPQQYRVTVFWRRHWTLQTTCACYRVSHCCSAAERPGLV